MHATGCLEFVLGLKDADTQQTPAYILIPAVHILEQGRKSGCYSNMQEIADTCSGCPRNAGTDSTSK